MRRVPRIDKLTNEQKDAMPGWRDKWIRIGLSTERADRPKFEAAVRGCYRAAGLAGPKRFVWVESPYVLTLACAAINQGAALAVRGPFSPVPYAITDAVDVAVRDAVDGAVAVDVTNAVDRDVGLAVSDAVVVAVDRAVEDAVTVDVGNVVTSDVGLAMGGTVNNAVNGVVSSAVHVAVRSDVTSAVNRAVSDVVSDVVSDAVGRAVEDAVTVDVGNVMSGPVSDAVDRTVNGTVNRAVDLAVSDAVGRDMARDVIDAVSSAVNRAVSDAVRSAVSGAVGSAASDAVQVAVSDTVDRAVEGAMRDAMRNVLTAQRITIPQYIGGQFWVGGWYGGPAFVSFFSEVCGLTLPPETTAATIAYQATSESACWWVPYAGVVLVSERPTKISRDEQGRLHSESGNAIEWPDGWGLASWHGTTVPLEWITERDKLDAKTALTWPNIEQRRAAAEIVGWAKVLSTLPYTVIDEDPDPQIGTLISVDLPDAPSSRFLLVRCPTGRDFALAVSPERITALEANAGTYRFDPSKLRKLEVRT